MAFSIYRGRQIIFQKYKIIRHLTFYERMYNDISKTDRLFLKAMTESPSKEVSTHWIAKKLGKNKNYISVYRARLLEDQLIFAPQRGFLQFNLPFFKEFILEYEKEHL